jgi:hypothetical protein
VLPQGTRLSAYIAGMFDGSRLCAEHRQACVEWLTSQLNPATNSVSVQAM